VELAGGINVALLGITHFSKGGQGSDPAQRVVGSVAFTAVARVVLVAAKVQSEEGQDRRILARGKSNIGPDEGGFVYHLAQGEALPGINASHIAWGAAVAGTARELLTDPGDAEDGEQTALEGAADFLREMLEDCPVWTKELEAQAKEAGIAWRTVRRAGDSMSIIKQRGAEGRWYWKLPRLSTVNSSNLASLSNVLNVDTLDNLADLAGNCG
jgi:putative DNA primase/helicase